LCLNCVNNRRLRLSPAERGRGRRHDRYFNGFAYALCWLAVTNSPVPKELLELLATVNIPQPHRAVVRPTDKQGGIRRIEADAIYVTAAIFSNVSFTGTNLRLSPAERGRQKEKSLANLWPFNSVRRSPFFGSHRMILLSFPPLARTLPSKDQATVLTL
jgi:hypothetical protein